MCVQKQRVVSVKACLKNAYENLINDFRRLWTWQHIYLTSLASVWITKTFMHNLNSLALVIVELFEFIRTYFN